MKSCIRLCALVVALSLLAVSPAYSSETTASSAISHIQVLEPSDGQYALFHGVVWLDHDKARFNYRWGGKHCDQQTLSDTSLGLLFSAFQAQHKVNLRYRNRVFNGQTYRCITGIMVART